MAGCCMYLPKANEYGMYPQFGPDEARLLLRRRVHAQGERDANGVLHHIGAVLNRLDSTNDIGRHAGQMTALPAALKPCASGMNAQAQHSLNNHEAIRTNRLLQPLPVPLTPPVLALPPLSPPLTPLSMPDDLLFRVLSGPCTSSASGRSSHHNTQNNMEDITTVISRSSCP
eukprot:1861093-Pleurochrysis_carterae.AAC.1